MNCRLIQGVFPPCDLCFQDRCWIHDDHDQDENEWMSEKLYYSDVTAAEEAHMLCVSHVIIY